MLVSAFPKTNWYRPRPRPRPNELSRRRSHTDVSSAVFASLSDNFSPVAVTTDFAVFTRGATEFVTAGPVSG